MTKNRQFHFYQQTKNCQLTDDRILLTEKTFHFNLLRHHSSRSFAVAPVSYTHLTLPTIA